MMTRLFLLILLAASTAACGTVTRGTKQGVKFESEPDGANVTVVRSKKEKTRWTCVSPCELQLSRKRDFDVTFEKAGYKPVSGRLASRIGAKGGATGVAGNAILGGGVGFIVDAGTGANMQLKPDPMRASLAPLGSADTSKIYDMRVEGGGRTTAESDAAADAMTGLPPSLGVTGSAVDGGVRIDAVEPGSPAARVGLQVGDILSSVNGTPVADMSGVDAALLGAGPESSLVVRRNGNDYTVAVPF